jgi:hypothetical protein
MQTSGYQMKAIEEIEEPAVDSRVILGCVLNE